ncbi:MAG: response regulator transcription factor [Clostridiales bacterium]|nr:response regulator transcription factor [Clostridiales bacterium]
MKHIVIVEDEALVREELSSTLSNNGYRVSVVEDFGDASNVILDLCPDLVLLDLNLPQVSGYQICRDLKNKSSIPVLILTSQDQLKDELHALELGADEFITKPYRTERLLMRISNVLKRFEGRGNLIEGPGFLLDRNTYTLYIDGNSCILPKNQGKLLEVLLEKRGSVVTKEDLCGAVWGTTEFIDENALQVNLTRLKKTMSGLQMKCHIVSVRGVGTTLQVPEE